MSLFSNLSSLADKTLAGEESVFVLTDRNVEKALSPLWEESAILGGAKRMVVEAGEESKDISTLASVWEWLSRSGATRGSVMVNVGGGMVTDLGLFAASTFKRGMRRIVNLPTTLLGMVDAAIGGKGGINVGGLKNEAGVFNPAVERITDTAPLLTLPREELLSGYGEMLKSGLIASPYLYTRLTRDIELYLENPQRLSRDVEETVRIKEDIVARDPFEKGERKALNFGHTVGHAMESLLMERGKGVPHGIAVAHGLLVEIILSHTVLGFPSAELYPYSEMLKEWFPRLPLGCKDTDPLLDIMTHDKKNRATSGLINFTLLREAGRFEIDCELEREEVATALDIYRDLTAAL
ncbi:MAG: 3-dehydroquinate synthase [Bacteroides sp.]|nr:3-dehydroquinate synthase [Bacteroides sp.]